MTLCYVVLPVFKGKCDPVECGSYRGIVLLEHAMKVVEWIFEHRIRQQIEIDDMQFGFMRGTGTTDAIFTLRCYASAVLAIALCPSVRPSQVGVLLKRLNVGSHSNTTR